MRVTILEGTPKEILEAAPDLLSGLKNKASEHTLAVATSSEEDAPSPITATAEERDEDWTPTYADYDFAKAVLTRRDVPESVATILKTLAKAHPEYVHAEDIMEELNMSGAQFRGVMGSFGRRVSHTNGYNEDDGQWFFDQEWVDEDGENKYRLPEAVLQAATDLGIVA